jgi:thioredoxin 1
MSIQFVDFEADWCGPCVAMKPVIEELEKELAGKVEIKKINVDQNQDEASKYGVMSIPTYLVLKDGKEVERFIGVTSKEVIKNKLSKHTS